MQDNTLKLLSCLVRNNIVTLDFVNQEIGKIKSIFNKLKENLQQLKCFLFFLKEFFQRLNG